jgi:uncharacterized membrane protein
MSLDPATLVAILAMAVISYLTRIAGIFVAGRLALRGRAKAAFDAIPPAVLVAVIAPMALATGWRETLAALLTAIAGDAAAAARGDRNRRACGGRPARPRLTPALQRSTRRSSDAQGISAQTDRLPAAVG